MTYSLGEVEHRPSVYGVQTSRGWAYRAVCACSAQTHPRMALPWRHAMAQALLHVGMASARQRTIDAQVAAFRQRLG